MTTTRFIVAGRFIDGSGAGVRRDVVLAVHRGVIAAIRPAAGFSPDPDGPVVDDLAHCTILPALVDCSVVLSRTPSVDRATRESMDMAGPAARRDLLERHIHYCHGYGVLGVADSDDREGLVARRRQEAGGGIRIRTAGPVCRRLRDCEHPLADRDFLRIEYSPSIGDLDDRSPRPGRQELERILRARGDRKGVVVANGERAVAEALAAGCDAIEQGYAMGEENLREMAARGVVWIPSVVRARNALDGAGSDDGIGCRFSQRYVSPEKPVPGAEAHWKETLAGHLALLRRARELGVTTALGTGAGSVGILHGESMVEEMKLFLKAGYTLAESFRCASENGARFFGMEGLGMLAPGRRATFLVSRGTVKQLPRKLAYLEGIYIDGAPSAIYRKDPVRAT